MVFENFTDEELDKARKFISHKKNVLEIKYAEIKGELIRRDSLMFAAAILKDNELNEKGVKET